MSCLYSMYSIGGILVSLGTSDRVCSSMASQKITGICLQLVRLNRVGMSVCKAWIALGCEQLFRSCGIDIIPLQNQHFNVVAVLHAKA